MDTVIFTLYNYASNQREEYLLLKLFKTALEEEIKYVHSTRKLQLICVADSSMNTSYLKEFDV